MPNIEKQRLPMPKHKTKSATDSKDQNRSSLLKDQNNWLPMPKAPPKQNGCQCSPKTNSCYPCQKIKKPLPMTKDRKTGYPCQKIKTKQQPPMLKKGAAHAKRSTKTPPMSKHQQNHYPCQKIKNKTVSMPQDQTKYRNSCQKIKQKPLPMRKYHKNGYQC